MQLSCPGRRTWPIRLRPIQIRPFPDMSSFPSRQWITGALTFRL